MNESAGAGVGAGAGAGESARTRTGTRAGTGTGTGTGTTKMARVIVHLAVLTAPAVACGRFEGLGRTQAIAIGVAMVVFAEVEAAACRAPDTIRASALGNRLALVSALGLLATAWAAIGWPASGAAAPAWTWLGAPALAMGIALRVVAIRTLGASFTSEIVAAPGHTLVTRGVYARMRHPSDVGLVLVAFGLAFLGASIAATLLALFVVAPSVLLRITSEDRVLAERHGEAFARYRRAVRLF